MTEKHAPVITVLDIETAPIIGNVWGLFDQNVGLNQIETEWSILSFVSKPLDPGALTRSIRTRTACCTYMDTSAAPGGPRDDLAVVQALWQIMHDSDIIIGQNLRRFDVRKIRARMLMHGMQPPSPFRVIDTLEQAKNVGAFTSNKLEWLSKYLSNVPKSKHKEFPGFELWSECLAGNPKAWEAMRKYNIPDVLSTEEVYLRLRPWASTHINVATYIDPETVACPVCGSEHVQEDGFSFSNVSKYQRYHCQECGAWSRSRYSLNSRATRKALLSK